MSDDTFKIDAGVKVPPAPPRSTKYPWDEMKIGDSFLVPCAAKDVEDKLMSLRSTVSAAGRRLKKTFIARAMEKGVRVWRQK